MNEDVFNKIKEILKDDDRFEIYYEIIMEAIKDEMESMNNGFFVKICESGKHPGDGIYVNKSDDIYYINKVNESIKHPFKADYKDVITILAYSYAIRTLSYIPNTSFTLVKQYTKEIENIIDKY